MELIKEIGIVSYTTKNGKMHNNASGKFECPVCHNIVIRPLAKGTRNNSCGNPECVIATRKKQKAYTHGRQKHYSGEISPSNKTSKLHPLYVIWNGMKARCYRESGAKYKNYGGRGIIVCEQWKNSFDNFYEDMGKEYLELKTQSAGSRKLMPSLDRIDNNGNYSPENCQWITFSENSSKDKRIAVVRMDYDGNILATYQSATEASEVFKSQVGARMLSPGVPHILEVCNGKRSEHVGYKWAFATSKEVGSQYDKLI